MKFKVGDKVRFTREAISYKLKKSMTMKYSIVLGSTVDEVSADKMYLVNYIWYSEEDLELVPEEPEFEFGEEIEVSDDGNNWNKAVFLCKTLGNDKYPYITALINKEELDKGERFINSAYTYARKLKPQLTRKEIAEKFSVSEDFTLVD